MHLLARHASAISSRVHDRFKVAIVLVIPAVIFPASSEALALPAALALVIAAGIAGGWIYGRDSRERALYAVPFSMFGAVALFVSRALAEDDSIGEPILIALVISLIPSALTFSIVARIAKSRAPATPSQNSAGDALPPPPAELGEISYTTWDAKSEDSTDAARRALFAAIPAFTVAVIVNAAIRENVAWSPLAFVAAAPIFVAVYWLSRRRRKCTYIGENGVARIELLRDGRSGAPAISAFNDVKLLRFRFDRAFSERQSYHGTIFRFELRSTRDKTLFEIRGKLHETEVLAAHLDKSSIAELDARHIFSFAHALRTAWLASLSAKADEQSPIPVGVWIEDAR
jgi:hypothetical protein